VETSREASGVECYPRKKINQITVKIGSKMGMLYRNTYPKKLGVLAFDCSEMDFTRKFGPLPM
jgi:hypothetical protein